MRRAGEHDTACCMATTMCCFTKVAHHHTHARRQARATLRPRATTHLDPDPGLDGGDLCSHDQEVRVADWPVGCLAVLIDLCFDLLQLLNERLQVGVLRPAQLLATASGSAGGVGRAGSGTHMVEGGGRGGEGSGRGGRAGRIMAASAFMGQGRGPRAGGIMAAAAFMQGGAGGLRARGIMAV